jgi:hypothetical protein
VSRCPPDLRAEDREEICTSLPAVAKAGLGARGVYIGRDQQGGSFVYDPWVLYTAGLLTDANVIVIGQLGWGKRSLQGLPCQHFFGRVLLGLRREAFSATSGGRRPR